MATEYNHCCYSKMIFRLYTYRYNVHTFTIYRYLSHQFIESSVALDIHRYTICYFNHHVTNSFKIVLKMLWIQITVKSHAVDRKLYAIKLIQCMMHKSRRHRFNYVCKPKLMKPIWIWLKQQICCHALFPNSRKKKHFFFLVVFLFVALNSENDEDVSHLKHRIIGIQNIYVDLIHFCVLFFQCLSSSIK